MWVKTVEKHGREKSKPVREEKLKNKYKFFAQLGV